MTRYLLQVALGPVQDFIFQARRTRDIWFGSHILSELSRGVARTLAGRGFTLIFPALTPDTPELQRCEDMRRPDGAPALAIANIILAVSPDIDEASLQDAAQAARQEAIATWSIFASRAFSAASPLLRAGLSEPDLRGAVASLIEFAAAWTALPDGGRGQGLTIARGEVASALAARKMLRDFDAWRGTPGLPKSSLDGFRETALIERPLGVSMSPSAADVAARFRIPRNEQLDAIGLVKRCGGRPEQFVPLARVALEPWIAALRDAELRRERARGTSSRWTDMVNALGAIVPKTTLAQIAPDSVAWLDDFPFDGELFLEDQWPNHPREDANEEDKRAYEAFTRDRVRTLLHGRSPDPYIACLVADGDRMGEALDLSSQADDADPLARLVTASRGIAGFAREVRAIVETHQGALVFAGGDDVLAFVPVTRSVACAEALRLRFSSDMEQAFPAPFTSPRPTLSVGLGIGHVLEPMRELIERARRAEGIAKRGLPGHVLPREAQRNALTIVSARRGGHEVILRRQWSSDPVQAIGDAVTVFLDEANGVPHGLPYEVRELLRRLPVPRLQDAAAQEPACGIGEVDAADPTWAAILRGELRRLLTQKQVMGLGAGATHADIDLVWRRLGLELADGSYGELVSAVGEWIDAALVVRHLAMAERACHLHELGHFLHPQVQAVPE